MQNMYILYIVSRKILQWLNYMYTNWTNVNQIQVRKVVTLARNEQDALTSFKAQIISIQYSKVAIKEI